MDLLFHLGLKNRVFGLFQSEIVGYGDRKILYTAHALLLPFLCSLQASLIKRKLALVKNYIQHIYCRFSSITFHYPLETALINHTLVLAENMSICNTYTTAPTAYSLQASLIDHAFFFLAERLFLTFSLLLPAGAFRQGHNQSEWKPLKSMLSNTFYTPLS